MKFLIFGFSSTSSRKSCCIFQKILLLRDENMFKIRLLYRILCRPTHKIDCCTSFFPSSKDDKSSKNPFCTEFLPPNASIIQSRQPAAGQMPQSSSRGSQQPDECLNRAVAAACSHAIATASSKRKPLPHPQPAFIRLLTWWVNRLIIHIPSKSNILTIYTRSEHGTGFIKS